MIIPRNPIYEFQSVFAPHLHGYLELKESLGEKITVPGNTLRQFDRYCCSIPIKEAALTGELVENWLLTKAGEKPETRSSRISVLWCFAKYYGSTGNEVSWRPVPGYAGRKNKYVPYIFSIEEISRILAAADAMPPSYGHSRFHLIFPALIRIMYACGLRVSEVLALKVEDVDLENAFLTINDAKFGKDRKLPFSDSLASYLKEYYTANSGSIGIDGDGWFFPNAKGGRYSQRTVYDKFRQILWAAGISHQGKGKGPRLHDVRHTFSVNALQQNIEMGKDTYTSLTGLMVYLGHSKISSTEYYLRLTTQVFPSFLEYSDSVCARAIPEVVKYEE